MMRSLLEQELEGESFSDVAAGGIAFMSDQDAPSTGEVKMKNSLVILVIWISGAVVVCQERHENDGNPYVSAHVGSVPDDWLAKYEGPHGDDEACSVQVDGHGNVYVLGSSYTQGSGFDFLLIKYDNDGQQIWERKYDGGSQMGDIAVKLILHDSYIYAAGNTGHGLPEQTNYAVLKYSADGRMIWCATYHNPDHPVDYMHDMAIDAEGYIYVTGNSHNQGWPVYMTTVKFNSDGELIWSDTYNNPSYTRTLIRAMDIDRDGNVYIAGHSGYEYDLAVFKYTPSGQMEWERYYDNGLDYIEEGVDIGIDKHNNIYVVGLSLKNLGSANMDIVLLKYNADGGFVWAEYYDCDGNEDRAMELKVDSEDHVVVISHCLMEEARHIVTLKYEPGGALLWEGIFDKGKSEYGITKSLAIGPDDCVHVAGDCWMKDCKWALVSIMYHADGRPGLPKKYRTESGDRINTEDIFVDLKGDVYITGTYNEMYVADIYTFKYDL